MDKEQQFFDLLFEEPKTIRGFINKYAWLRSGIFEAPFDSKEFILLKNMINETVYKLKTLINNTL